MNLQVPICRRELGEPSHRPSTPTRLSPLLTPANVDTQFGKQRLLGSSLIVQYGHSLRHYHLNLTRFRCLVSLMRFALAMTKRMYKSLLSLHVQRQATVTHQQSQLNSGMASLPSNTVDIKEYHLTCRKRTGMSPLWYCKSTPESTLEAPCRSLQSAGVPPPLPHKHRKPPPETHPRKRRKSLLEQLVATAPPLAASQPISQQSSSHSTKQHLAP